MSSDFKYNTLFYLAYNLINLDIISYVEDSILGRIVLAYMKLKQDCNKSELKSTSCNLKYVLIFSFYNIHTLSS